MRIFTYTILAIVFSLSGCSSQKELVDNPPFEMGEVTSQSWVGGRPESGSGTKLEIQLLSDNVDGMNLQQAFFRGKIADFKIVTKEGKNIAIANFNRKSTDKPDIIAHRDATKEVGNQPPKLQDEFPFEISANDCVISYLDGKKLKYYKLEGVKEKKPLIYK